MKKLFITFLLFAAVAPAQDKSQPRTITVTGEAEVRVAPEEVAFSFVISSDAKTLASAKAEHDARAKKVLAAAQDAGVAPKDIQTERLRMGPKYEEVKDREVFVGYVVSQSMTIVLRDLDKYEDLLSKILEAGVTRVGGIEFGARDMQRYRDEARVLAIRAAKDKATSLAKELNQTLGKPLTIYEGKPDVSQLANATGNEFREQFWLARATVAPGQLVARAAVTVTFALE
jgi:uncharacterized protein YggE